MLHHPETCEGCNKTSEENHSLLCEKCREKAAMYDITKRDKEYLIRLRDSVLEDLEQTTNPGNSDDIVILLISRAIAQLRASQRIIEKAGQE